MSQQTFAVADPVFGVDWNEIGRLGYPEGTLWVGERWLHGYPPNSILASSWIRKYQSGEYVTLIDEEGATCQALVLEVRDNTLGHGYVVRPHWDSYTIIRATQ